MLSCVTFASTDAPGIWVQGGEADVAPTGLPFTGRYGSCGKVPGKVAGRTKVLASGQGHMHSLGGLERPGGTLHLHGVGPWRQGFGQRPWTKAVEWDRSKGLILVRTPRAGMGVSLMRPSAPGTVAGTEQVGKTRVRTCYQ